MLSLTDMDIVLLVKHSYMDLSSGDDFNTYNQDVSKLLAEGALIGNTDKYFLKGGIADRREEGRVRFSFQAIMTEVRQNEHLKGLRLVAHENHNVKPGNPEGTGLVISAFINAEQSDIIFVTRGSEGGMFEFAEDWVERIAKREWTDVIKSEDWRDNFIMVFGTSACFNPAAAFVESVISRFPDKNYSVYGHSKGGGLAIYLAARYGFSGVSIDGMGLPVDTFIDNPDYKERLEKTSFINKCAENDIVSELLLHYEKRAFLAMNHRFSNENGIMVSPFGLSGFINAHYPDALRFDIDGMCLPGEGECVLPRIVSVINKALMLNITYEKLSAEQKAANKQIVETAVARSANIIDMLATEVRV